MKNTALTSASHVNLDSEDLAALKAAKNRLENPGIAIKISNMVGRPLEIGLEKLPKSWHKKMGTLTQEALFKAVDTAIFTLKETTEPRPKNHWHTVGAAVSGGVGGFFGFPGLAVELPLTTTLILRSILDIARAEGAAVGDMETKLACLEVFALGGRTVSDDGSETGYYMVRSFLAKSLSETASYIARNGVSGESAPIVLKFITRIAERFGIQVSEKFVAQSIPIVGALGGAAINSLFMQHFQSMAKGHFLIRKLERKYGKNYIETVYKKL